MVLPRPRKSVILHHVRKIFSICFPGLAFVAACFASHGASATESGGGRLVLGHLSQSSFVPESQLEQGGVILGEPEDVGFASDPVSESTSGGGSSIGLEPDEQTTSQSAFSASSSEPAPGGLEPGQAARQLLATHYQSCGVLDVGLGLANNNGITNPETYLRQHQRWPDGSQCLDRSEHDFRWELGGDAVLRGNKYDVSGHFDCSGVVSTALAMAGLKTQARDGDNEYRDFNTRGLMTLVGKRARSRSCFETPQFRKVSPWNILKAGDILNQSNTLPENHANSGARHMVMIDTVGEDPLGFAQITQLSQCNRLSQNDFNFTYIESGARAADGFSGMVRGHGRQRGGSLGRGLVQYAREACRSYVRGRGLDFGVYNFKNASAKDKHKQFAHIRHKSEKRGCQGTPVSVRGQQCPDGDCYAKIRQTRTL